MKPNINSAGVHPQLSHMDFQEMVHWQLLVYSGWHFAGSSGWGPSICCEQVGHRKILFLQLLVYFGWQCACSSGWRPSMHMNRSQKNSISRSSHSRIYKNRNTSKLCVDEEVDMMGRDKCILLNKTWGANTSLMSILWALPPLIVGSSYFITLSIVATFTLALIETNGGISHNICFFGGVT